MLNPMLVLSALRNIADDSNLESFGMRDLADLKEVCQAIIASCDRYLVSSDYLASDDAWEDIEDSLDDLSLARHDIQSVSAILAPDTYIAGDDMEVIYNPYA